MRLAQLQLALVVAACSGTHVVDAGRDAGPPDAGGPDAGFDAGPEPTDAGPDEVVCRAATPTDRCAGVSCPAGRACLAGECFDECGDLGVLERALHSATVRDVWCLPGEAYFLSTYQGTEPGASTSIRLYAVTGTFDDEGYAHTLTSMRGVDDVFAGPSHEAPEVLTTGRARFALAGEVPAGGVTLWASGSAHALSVRSVLADGSPGRGWIQSFDRLRDSHTFETLGGGLYLTNAAGPGGADRGLHLRGPSGWAHVARHSLVPGGVDRVTEPGSRSRGLAVGVMASEGARAAFVPTWLLEESPPVDLETHERVTWFMGAGPRVAQEGGETVWAWSDDAPLFRFYKPPTPSRYECQRIADPVDGRLPIIDVVTSAELSPMLAFDTDGDGRAEGVALLGLR